MLQSRIGKLLGFAILLISTFVSVASHITLRVVSMREEPIDAISVGEPCILEVIVPGSVTAQSKPVIQGLETASIMQEQERMQLSMINGIKKQERITRYVVTFSQEGLLQVGPTKISTLQGELFSNTVLLKVRSKEVTSPRAAQSAVFAKLQLSKNSAFVGEGVPYTVRFYYVNESVRRVIPLPFSIAGALLVQSDTVRRGSEQQQGQRLNFLEWTGIIYPQQAGELRIPCLSFEYLEPQASLAHSPWMQFATLMGSFLVTKQQQTDAVTMHIDAVPASQEFVCGVGAITRIDLAGTLHEVRQGESLVCTVQIEGNAHMDTLQMPPFNVPKALKVYESSTQSNGIYPRYTKSYEYIVQGLEPGLWTIPEQKFVFFNPEKKHYETFTTEPYVVEVLPDARQDVSKEEMPADLEDVTVVGDDVSPFPEKEPVVVPFWMLLGGIFFPVVWVLTRKYVYQRCKKIKVFACKRRTIVDARAKLQDAVEKNDAYAFLAVWKHVIVIITEQDEASLDEMSTYLRARGCSEEEWVQWQMLLNHITSAVFFESDKALLLQLFQDSEQCLEIIQKYVKL